MHTTKKQMLDEYPILREKNDLLSMYLYDTQTGAKPAGVERGKNGHNDPVRIELYRPTSAHGGYVVICGALHDVFYLDDANRRYADNHSEYTLGTRICLERLTILRNKLMAA